MSSQINQENTVKRSLFQFHTVDQGQFKFEPDRHLVPAFVTRGKYRPEPILCWLGYNFDGTARLLQYSACHRPIRPTLLAQFSVVCLCKENRGQNFCTQRIRLIKSMLDHQLDTHKSSDFRRKQWFCFYHPEAKKTEVMYTTHQGEAQNSIYVHYPLG